MKKIMLVFGTRPEAIKMCPLAIELKKNKDFKTLVCVTGQHREMLDQVLDVFNIVPDYDLNIMKKTQSLFDITCSVLNEIREVFIKERPDLVLVHGDTTTSFSAALAAFYLNICIGHVEAGLRTYDLKSPYPEELNRQAISIVADFNFAPTKIAANNLIREGKHEKTVYITGNTAIDALRYTFREDFKHKILDWTEGRKLILITAHRRENIGEPMRRMFKAIKRMIDENSNVCALYPIHKNPEVRKIAADIFGDDDGILFVEPLDVVDFHNIMARSYLILTDSGGIQEEAPYFNVPVLVMRDTTERPEGIEAGTSKLVGTNENNIYNVCSEMLNNDIKYELMRKATNPYGDGHACERIIDILQESFYSSI